MKDHPIKSMEKLIEDTLSSFSENDLRKLSVLQEMDPLCHVERLEIDFQTSFAAGICIGIRPDKSKQLYDSSYPKHTLLNLHLYQYILSEFQKQEIGIGIDIKSKMIHLMGLFSKKYAKDYPKRFIRPILDKFEERFQVELCAGIGFPAFSHTQLKNSYKTAEFAFGLYFFEHRPILELQKINQFFNATLEDYDFYAEEAIKAILTKSPDVLDKIERVIDIIGRIHYGNPQAVRMRTMDYTGDLASKLRRYHLLGGDFFEMQNELQMKVINSMSMAELKSCIHEHYKELIIQIYKGSHPDSKILIERVKKYIRENYMNELSMKELAEIACVSSNYFSHMFKNETGINYKTYLTNIRLEKAVELLMESDFKLYEICERVGYKNVRTFVDAFKKKYRVSPISYKKSMRSKNHSMKGPPVGEKE